MKHNSETGTIRTHGSTVADDLAVLQDRHLRPVREGELREALRLMIREAGSKIATIDAQVDAFIQLAGQQGCDLRGLTVLERDGKLEGACCHIPQSGGTAFVFTSGTQADTSEAFSTAMAQMHRQLAGRAFAAGSNLLQALILPEDDSRSKILRQADYQLLTDLSYLRCDIGTSQVSVDTGEGINWLTYTSQHRELFKDVIARTYRESLDCPELETKRSMENVLLGHQASGQFNPNLWFLLQVRGHPVGALLLAPLRDGGALELTYMGLEPSARGKGLGRVLLAQTLRVAKQQGMTYVLLAVDQRNAPAKRLYSFFGFTQLFDRRVFILSKK